MKHHVGEKGSVLQGEYICIFNVFQKEHSEYIGSSGNQGQERKNVCTHKDNVVRGVSTGEQRILDDRTMSAMTSRHDAGASRKIKHGN